MSPLFPGFGVALPIQEEFRVADLVALAVRAEETGFATVWTGEIAGPEIFSLLGAVAVSTDSVRLGAGVVSVFTRSAALTGMGFATLAGLAPGRVVAGIGVGSRFIVERWHGGAFTDTAETLVEYAEVLRSVVAGERIAHPGPRVHVDAFRVTVPDAAPMPVFFGAMTPLGLRLAGRHADGVVLAFCPPSEIARRVGIVRDAAAAAGRDPDDVEIVAYLNCDAGDHTEAAVERMRRLIVQYAVQPTHAPSFVGVFDRIEEAQRLWAAQDRAAAAALVDDDVVAALTPVGEAALVVDRLSEMRAAGVDEAIVFPQVPTPGDSASALVTVERVAAELARRAS
ncbi:MAG: LLM class flavin-dependent oxidoreductase [Acidimicrobiales bacterium]